MKRMRSLHWTLILAALIVVSPEGRGAQFPEGAEARLGTGQILGGAENGDFALVAPSETQDGIFQVQLFDGNAVPLGAAFPVPAPSGCVEFGFDGGFGGGPVGEAFLWLWTEGVNGGPACGYPPPRADLFGRVFSRNGEPLSPVFQVNSVAEGQHLFPAFEALPDGGWLVSWSMVTGDENEGGDFRSNQFFRHFDADGTPRESEIRISGTGMFDPLDLPAITLLPSGGFSIAWSYLNSGGIGELALRSFDATGRAVTEPIVLGEDSNSPYSGANFVAMLDGSRWVTWWGNRVLARRLDANGIPEAERIQISTKPTGRSFSEVHSIVNASGNVLVTWTSDTDPRFEAPGDGSGLGVFGQWMSPEGEKLGTEFQINARFRGYQALRELRLSEQGEPLALFGTGNLPIEPMFARRFSSSCHASDTTLCLGEEGRFRVEVAWEDFSQRDGQAGGEALSEESGYFWFFRPDNVELMVKVVDGGSLNGNFWVFYGALSNVAYQLTVTDTLNGLQKVYRNEAENFGSVGDTEAFPELPPGLLAKEVGGGQSLDPSALVSLFPEVPQLDRDLPSTGKLFPNVGAGTAAEPFLFEGGRFSASLDWRDFSGNTGIGHGVALTPDTAYFWFFNPLRAEVVVKILDGRSINDHIWVFYGALSNVEYTLTVEDRPRGLSQTYFNPLGNFGSVGDTEAFPQ